MGATKYDWTDKTKTGLAKEEFDDLWTAINAISPALDDLSDVVITSVGNLEVLSYDTGTSKWINRTAAEAGLAISTHNHDVTYLRLTGGVLTGALNITGGGPSIIINVTTPKLEWEGPTKSALWQLSSSRYFQVAEDGTQKGRFDFTDDTWESPLPATEPGGTLAGTVAFYQDESADELWAKWKETGGGAHHGMVSRALRSFVWLTPGAFVGDASLWVGGANSHVGLLRFPNGSTKIGMWTFERPIDWDVGKIMLQVFWTNYANSVSGNHFVSHILQGWTDGEDIAANNGLSVIATGDVTITGLSNAGKIGQTSYAAGSIQDLTNEKFFSYRLKRKGSHASDTSTRNWEVLGCRIILSEVS